VELCIDPRRGRRTSSSSASELREHLARAIEQLPERERQILSLYYEEELTLAEIGAVIGVCESRVSQLRSLAVSRLRSALRESLGGGAAALRQAS
jgi:RNA polymerase sigma factor FliA